MKINDEISIVEAVLFASGEPIEGDNLARCAGMELNLLQNVVDLLNDRYESQDSALIVLRLGTYYQLATRPKYIGYIRSALENKKSTPLSPAAMEVLTIVAYNQPVTKGFVEHVRGIDSSSVVNSLVEKDLLEEAGRLDVPGRPIAYKTTSTFLRCFQLSSIESLPPIPSQDGQVSFDEILIRNDEISMDDESSERIIE